MYNKINNDENILSLQTKGNIQSVLTLVIRDPEGRRGNNHTFYEDVPLKDWLIEWGLAPLSAVFQLHDIVAVWRIENWPKLIYPKQVYMYYTLYLTIFFTRRGEKLPPNLYNCFISLQNLLPFHIFAQPSIP